MMQDPILEALGITIIHLTLADFTQPYVYSYTVSVGNEPVRYTSKTYYLETVAYNLKSPENAQLVAVVTSTLEDPKDAYKTAEKYAKEIVNALKK
jgi:hypothetical protein